MTVSPSTSTSTRLINSEVLTPPSLMRKTDPFSTFQTALIQSSIKRCTGELAEERHKKFSMLLKGEGSSAGRCT